MASFSIFYTGSRYLRSALSTSDDCYGLSIQGGAASDNAPIILSSWQGGAQDELWYLDEYGHLVTVLNSEMVIAIGAAVPDGSGNYLVLTGVNGTNPVQEWVLQADGTIGNASTGQVISVNGSAAKNGAAIICCAAVTGAANQLWWTAPALPSGDATQSYFVQSALSDLNADYGLAVSHGRDFVGTPVILQPWQGGQPSELWEFDGGSPLVSRVGQSITGKMVLGSGEALPGRGNDMIIQPRVPGLAQSWDLHRSGMLINQMTLLALTANAAVASSGTPVITAPVVEKSGTPAQVWQLRPGNPLLASLTQAPMPFPAFTDAQLQAYQYINQQLALGEGNTPDLRGQYVNFNVDLAGYLALIGQMTPNVDAADWDAVTGQLGDEIEAASNVQDMIVNYQSLWAAIFEDEGALLGKLGTDAAMSPTTTVSGVGTEIFVGIAYTLLNFFADGVPVGPAMAAVGNLMETAVNASQAAGSQTPMVAFQTAYAELWGALSQNFSQVWQATQNLAWILLSDWGKLSVIGPLTAVAGPGGMAFPPQPQALAACQAGYTIAVMQMLLPTTYWSYWQYSGNESGKPTYDNFFIYVGEDVYQDFWIAPANFGNGSLPNAVFEDLFGTAMGNLVNVADFYVGAGGWKLPVHCATVNADSPSGG